MFKQNGGHTTVQMMAMVTGDSRQREWMSAKRTIGSERHQPSAKYIRRLLTLIQSC